PPGPDAAGPASTGGRAAADPHREQNAPPSVAAPHRWQRAISVLSRGGPAPPAGAWRGTVAASVPRVLPPPEGRRLSSLRASGSDACLARPPIRRPASFRLGLQYAWRTTCRSRRATATIPNPRCFPGSGWILPRSFAGTP